MVLKQLGLINKETKREFNTLAHLFEIINGSGGVGFPCQFSKRNIMKTNRAFTEIFTCSNNENRCQPQGNCEQNLLQIPTTTTPQYKFPGSVPTLRINPFPPMFVCGTCHVLFYVISDSTNPHASFFATFQVSVADIENAIQGSYPFRVADLQSDFTEMVMSVSGL